MVCLNKNISFKKLELKKNISKELINEINYNFNLNDSHNHVKLENNINLEIIKTIISKVNKIVEKKVNDLFSSDYFIYKNMDDNICTHKIKKGKNADNFCCKKITKNGDRTKYVCTKHNKNHIPKKRNIKNKQINIITEKYNPKPIYINKLPSILGIKNNNKKIYKKNTKNSKNFKKIKVYGLLDFNYILSKLLN